MSETRVDTTSPGGTSSEAPPGRGKEEIGAEAESGVSTPAPPGRSYHERGFSLPPFERSESPTVATVSPTSLPHLPHDLKRSRSRSGSFALRLGQRPRSYSLSSDKSIPPLTRSSSLRSTGSGIGLGLSEDVYVDPEGVPHFYSPPHAHYVRHSHHHHILDEETTKGEAVPGEADTGARSEPISFPGGNPTATAAAAAAKASRRKGSEASCAESYSVPSPPNPTPSSHRTLSERRGSSAPEWRGSQFCSGSEVAEQALNALEAESEGRTLAMLRQIYQLEAKLALQAMQEQQNAEQQQSLRQALERKDQEVRAAHDEIQKLQAQVARIHLTLTQKEEEEEEQAL